MIGKEHRYMICPFAEYGSRRDPSEKPFLLQRVSAVGTQRRCQGNKIMVFTGLVKIINIYR